MRKSGAHIVDKPSTRHGSFAQLFVDQLGAGAKVSVFTSFVLVQTTAFSTQINHILNLLNDGLYTVCTGLTTKTTIYVNNRILIQEDNS